LGIRRSPPEAGRFHKLCRRGVWRRTQSILFHALHSPMTESHSCTGNRPNNLRIGYLLSSMRSKQQLRPWWCAAAPGGAAQCSSRCRRAQRHSGAGEGCRSTGCCSHSRLRNSVDTLIVIPNQNLFRVTNEKTTFADAFAIADQVLHSGVACITDLVVKLRRLCLQDLGDVSWSAASDGLVPASNPGWERRVFWNWEPPTPVDRHSAAQFGLHSCRA
jgi:hypothetical protein